MEMFGYIKYFRLSLCYNLKTNKYATDSNKQKMIENLETPLKQLKDE